MKKATPILCIYLLALLSLAAVTRINLTNQATGLLPIANAGTATATAAAGTVLAGPASGGAAAYSFRVPMQILETAHLATPKTRLIAFLIADGSTVNGTGFNAAVTAGGCTETLANATLGTHCAQTWGATTCTNDFGHWAFGSSNPKIKTLQTSAIFFTRMALVQTTDTRAWFGFGCDNTGFRNSDDPAATAIACFHYCNDGAGAGCSADLTTWQAYTNDTAGGGSTSDTGITVDTNNHTFLIVDIGTGFDFYIDGVSVATRSDNLPAAGTLLSVGGFACSPQSTGGTFRYSWGGMTFAPW
jgi:hypothetical protein